MSTNTLSDYAICHYLMDDNTEERKESRFSTNHAGLSPIYCVHIPDRLLLQMAIWQCFNMLNVYFDVSSKKSIF